MQVLTGNEPFRFHKENLKKGKSHLKKEKSQSVFYTISDFWRWNSSDLLNNTLRGALAEFIIATALNLDLTQTRDDWASYDLLWGKVRIEVKCSGYLQSWYPKDKPDTYSKIIFSISPALEWLPDECRYKPDSYKRHSDVYVFCHYTSKERAPENPLNLDNWDFYILATYKIDNIFGKQKAFPLNL